MSHVCSAFYQSGHNGAIRPCRPIYSINILPALVLPRGIKGSIIDGFLCVSVRCFFLCDFFLVWYWNHDLRVKTHTHCLRRILKKTITRDNWAVPIKLKQLFFLFVWCIKNFNFRGRFLSSSQPWEFALIGSAAFAGGVTRAVSTAVIVFELSGQNHLRLPLGVALMISYFIANWFTKGIYDALMDTNGTPYLFEVR